MAFEGSRHADETSRRHALTTIVVADEVAQADAGHSVRSHERQAVARSSDIVNNSPRAIKCFNCQKFGHYARDCRNSSGTGYDQGQGTAGNMRERRPQSRPYSNFKHRVSTVGPSSEQEVIKEEGEVAEASGYTANCMSSADINKPGKPSALY